MAENGFVRNVRTIIDDLILFGEFIRCLEWQTQYEYMLMPMLAVPALTPRWWIGLTDEGSEGRWIWFDTDRDATFTGR